MFIFTLLLIHSLFERYNKKTNVEIFIFYDRVSYEYTFARHIYDERNQALLLEYLLNGAFYRIKNISSVLLKVFFIATPFK